MQRNIYSSIYQFEVLTIRFKLIKVSKITVKNVLNIANDYLVEETKE